MTDTERKRSFSECSAFVEEIPAPPIKVFQWTEKDSGGSAGFGIRITHKNEACNPPSLTCDGYMKIAFQVGASGNVHGYCRGCGARVSVSVAAVRFQVPELFDLFLQHKNQQTKV